MAPVRFLFGMLLRYQRRRQRRSLHRCHSNRRPRENRKRGGPTSPGSTNSADTAGTSHIRAVSNIEGTAESRGRMIGIKCRSLRGSGGRPARPRIARTPAGANVSITREERFLGYYFRAQHSNTKPFKLVKGEVTDLFAHYLPLTRIGWEGERLVLPRMTMRRHRRCCRLFRQHRQLSW